MRQPIQSRRPRPQRARREPTVNSAEPSPDTFGATAPGILSPDRQTPCSDSGIAALTLDGRGTICDCNRDAEMLFRCRRSQLVWQHISILLPELAGVDLLPGGMPNPRLRYLCRVGRTMTALTHDGMPFPVDLFLNAVSRIDQDRLLLVVRPIASVRACQLAIPHSADDDELLGSQVRP